jgi:heme a synthase
MNGFLDRLRQHTDGFTVTPRQYAVVAYVALAALTLIVLTGAAVRLTGSGLGCPEWPRCYGSAYPPLNTHAVIEFSNRLITFPVCIAAAAAWLLARRRRPYRRDLTWIAALLPLGVVAQAVLGGLTVRGALDYGWVMSHFALSMLILAAAVTLTWRARRYAFVDVPTGGSSNGRSVPLAGLPRAVVDRTILHASWALVALAALTIFAGTAATAAGPHAGGSPGQKINRLDFHGRATMDFVIHRHAEIAFAFALLSLLVWYLARRRHADPLVRRSLTVLCVLLALQGVVGLDQYETHLPTELVWVHVALACAAWIAALWGAWAAGAGVPAADLERRLEVVPSPRVSV